MELSYYRTFAALFHHVIVQLHQPTLKDGFCCCGYFKWTCPAHTWCWCLLESGCKGANWVSVLMSASLLYTNKEQQKITVRLSTSSVLLLGAQVSELEGCQALVEVHTLYVSPFLLTHTGMHVLHSRNAVLCLFRFDISHCLGGIRVAPHSLPPPSAYMVKTVLSIADKLPMIASS